MSAAEDLNEMEVDGAVDNDSNVDDDIDMNATEFPLVDLPNEVLVVVLSHLNDTSLLDMTLVSKRFRALAKKAFAKKYNGETEAAFYYLRIFCESETEEHRLYHPYFQTFGENMPAIKIEFSEDYFGDIPNNHWMYKKIQNHCTALTKVHISKGGDFNLAGILTERTSRMLTFLRLDNVFMLDGSWADRVYPKLAGFHAESDDFGSNELNTLFANNPQITDLKLSRFNFEFDILAQLRELKSLYIEDGEVTFGPDKFQMDSLEKCELVHDSPWLTLIEIGAACKHLKRLSIHEYVKGYIDWIEESIEIETICSFKELKSLRISVSPDKLTLDQLTSITESLSKLTSLQIDSVSLRFIDERYDLSRICKNLKRLELELFSEPDDLGDGHIFRQLADLTNNNRSMQVLVDWKYLRAISTEGRVRPLYVKPGFNHLIFLYGIDSLDPSTSNLHGLDERSLEKIGANSQIALLNCQRTQRIVKDYLSNHLFHLTNDVDVDSSKNVAEHIHHMNVDDWTTFGTELNFEWPNIKTLKISKCAPTHLLSLKCPMLTHLEVKNLEDMDQPTLDGINVNMLDFNGAYRNLTTLKFGCYNDGVELLLSRLNESICEQMQNLSLIGVSDQPWDFVEQIPQQQRQKNLKLVNILMRFRNLTALHLLFPRVENWNLKCLFEKCTKLTDLAICFKKENRYIEYDDIFELIKENCCQMRNIRLVEQREVPFHPDVMQRIQRLLPGVTIEIINVNGSIVHEKTSIESIKKRPDLFTALEF